MIEAGRYQQGHANQSNNDVKLEAIERLVETSFRAKLGEAALLMPSKFSYWDAAFYGLENSSLFQRLPEGDREAILFDLSQIDLAEVFFLKNFGMTLALRLGPSAGSLQEKLFFSLMAGEEAIHLRALMPYLARPPRIEDSGIAQIISRFIETASRDALLILVQVIAKGWQVTQFAKFAKACQNETLASTLRVMLQDESRHHGMGLVLATRESLTVADSHVLHGALVEILNWIRLGPVSLVSALSRRIGTLSWDEKRFLFEQTRTMLGVQMKLELIKSLCKGLIDSASYSSLDEAGLFRPWTLNELADRL